MRKDEWNLSNVKKSNIYKHKAYDILCRFFNLILSFFLRRRRIEKGNTDAKTNVAVAIKWIVTTVVSHAGVWLRDVHSNEYVYTRLYLSDTSTYIRLPCVDLRTARLTMSELSRYYLGGYGAAAFPPPRFTTISISTPLASVFLPRCNSIPIAEGFPGTYLRRRGMNSNIF